MDDKQMVSISSTKQHGKSSTPVAVLKQNGSSELDKNVVAIDVKGLKNFKALSSDSHTPPQFISTEALEAPAESAQAVSELPDTDYDSAESDADEINEHLWKRNRNDIAWRWRWLALQVCELQKRAETNDKAYKSMRETKPRTIPPVTSEGEETSLRTTPTLRNQPARKLCRRAPAPSAKAIAAEGVDHHPLFALPGRMHIPATPIKVVKIESREEIPEVKLPPTPAPKKKAPVKEVVLPPRPNGPLAIRIPISRRRKKVNPLALLNAPTPLPVTTSNYVIMDNLSPPLATPKASPIPQKPPTPQPSLSTSHSSLSPVTPTTPRTSARKKLALSKDYDIDNVIVPCTPTAITAVQYREIITPQWRSVDLIETTVEDPPPVPKRRRKESSSSPQAMTPVSIPTPAPAPISTSSPSPPLPPNNNSSSHPMPLALALVNTPITPVLLSDAMRGVTSAAKTTVIRPFVSKRTSPVSQLSVSTMAMLDNASGINILATSNSSTLIKSFEEQKRDHVEKCKAPQPEIKFTVLSESLDCDEEFEDDVSSEEDTSDEMFATRHMKQEIEERKRYLRPLKKKEVEGQDLITSLFVTSEDLLSSYNAADGGHLLSEILPHVDTSSSSSKRSRRSSPPASDLESDSDGGEDEEEEDLYLDDDDDDDVELEDDDDDEPVARPPRRHKYLSKKKQRLKEKFAQIKSNYVEGEVARPRRRGRPPGRRNHQPAPIIEKTDSLGADEEFDYDGWAVEHKKDTWWWKEDNLSWAVDGHASVTPMDTSEQSPGADKKTPDRNIIRLKRICTPASPPTNTLPHTEQHSTSSSPTHSVLSSSSTTTVTTTTTTITPAIPSPLADSPIVEPTLQDVPYNINPT